MERNRHGRHTVTRLTVHLVWVTKYRYHVLKGDIQKRCRPLLIQICAAEDLRIRKGGVRKEHVHMLSEYPPSQSLSVSVKRLTGRPARLLQHECPTVRKRSWGKPVWAIGYGAWSAGNIPEDRVAEYLEHHRDPSNQDTDPLSLE